MNPDYDEDKYDMDEYGNLLPKQQIKENDLIPKEQEDDTISE